MKQWMIVASLVMGILVAIYGAAGQTTTQPAEVEWVSQPTTVPAEADTCDDVSPMQAAFVLVAMIVLALAAVAGAVVLVVLAIIALLGIISTATVVGLLKRSTGSAIKAFAYQALALAGLLSGIAAGLVVHWIRPQAASGWHLVGVGGLSGAVLGVILAAVLIWAVRAMWRAIAR